MQHEENNMPQHDFEQAKLEAVNAELRARGLPPMELAGAVCDDLPANEQAHLFNEAYLDEQVDRWCESDAHLERYAARKLAALVASEIIDQHHDWARKVRGLDPLTPSHFDKWRRRDYSSFDEQLHTFYTEFADPRKRTERFWVATDARHTKSTVPVLEETLRGGPSSRRYPNWVPGVGEPSPQHQELRRKLNSQHRVAVPLEQFTPIAQLEQYRKVAERRIDPVVKGCQLNLSYQCLQTRRNQLFAYKQGDFVCVAKCCRHCIALFDVDDAEYHLSRPVGSFELTGRTFSGDES